MYVLYTDLVVVVCGTVLFSYVVLSTFKISLVAFHALLTRCWDRSYYARRSSAKKAPCKRVLGDALTLAYVLGLAALPVFEVAAPLVGPLARYPFLTLMAYSIYCALGLVYCWIRIYCRCLIS